ncbi:MAG TPA: hypothetical protein DCE14_06695 [Kosmotogaceae bacterium]|nr:hypothetical protein [Kosmotogaceae bacterium]
MWFMVLFVVVYVSSSLVSILLEMINLKHATSKNASIPRILEDKINDEEFEKSKAYTADKTKVGVTHSVVSLFLGLYFVIYGLRHLETLSKRATDSLFFQALLMLGILAGVFFIVSLFFRIYAVFVVEEKYGFNRTTPRLFVFDTIKSMIIAALIGTGLVWISIWLITTFSFWWVLLWLVFVAFELIVVWIFPTVIVPLFNKLWPLEEGSLRNRIESLAESAGFVVKKISLMDASRRSRHSNAFFAGLGKTKKIVLYDNLVENLDEDQIAAVVAHEIGHSKLGHILRRFLLGSFIMLGMLLFAWAIVTSGIVESAFGTSQVYTSMLYALIFLSSLDFFLEPLVNGQSRRHEFEADAYSAKALGSGQHLISALKNLAKHNLSNLNPHPVYALFNYSHPTLVERARALGVTSGPNA